MESRPPNGKTTDTSPSPERIELPVPRFKPRTGEEIAALEAAENERYAATCVRKLAMDFGSRYTHELASFASFQADKPAQKAAVKTVKAFAENAKAFAALGRCLILYGTVGTGKDHLLAACMYAAAAQGLTCRRVNGQDLYSGIRDTMDQKGSSEAAFLEKWAEPEILGLSDPVPPVGELSPWRKELLYRLINRRYEFLRPTLFTINVNSPEEADQKLGQQVWDRVQHNGVIVPCLWPSYREMKK